MYRYKMIQVPPNLVVSKEAQVAGAASSYLEQLANKMAVQGWEFYRVDTVGIAVKPGCWGLLSGQRESFTNYYVVTFRQPTAAQ